jgi:SAM-dependent methyltransferase
MRERRRRAQQTSITAALTAPEASPSLPPAGRYHDHSRDDIRVARPWDRYAHHINTLPARLEALAADLNVQPGQRVLDYGCADVPYRHFFPADVDFVPADLPGNPRATVDIAADGTLPLPDRSVDAVMSTQVLEHVADPATYVAECFRVLRPGGRLLLSTHGTFIYHPDPVDFWRWTCAGLDKQLRDAGFEIVRFEGIIGLAATGLQLFQDAVLYRFPRRIQQLLALINQSLIRLVDRKTSDANKRMNAQVYAVVATRPRDA